MRVSLTYIGVTVFGLIGAYVLATTVGNAVAASLNSSADMIAAATQHH